MIRNIDRGKDGEIELRRGEVFKLRLAGLSFREIGERVGVSHVTVFRDYSEVMSKLAEETRESAEQVRAIELARLDSMLDAVWGNARAGDPKSVELALKIQERRSKYLGLDSPEKHAVAVASAEATPEAAAAAVRKAFGDHAVKRDDDVSDSSAEG